MRLGYDAANQKAKVHMMHEDVEINQSPANSIVEGINLLGMDLQKALGLQDISYLERSRFRAWFVAASQRRRKH